MGEQSLNGAKIQLHTYLLMAYCFSAPIEDLLTGSAGTLAKYLALMILIVGLVEYRRRLYLPLTTENTCIVLLLLISVLSLLWSIDTSVTLHRLIAYLLVPGFCLFVSIISFSEREFDLIAWATILGGIAGAVFALRSGYFLNDMTRLILTEESDPNGLAARLFLPLGLAIYKTHTAPRKLFSAAAAVVLMLTIFLTGSRGGLLGVLVMVVIYAIGAFKNIKPSTILLFAFAAVALWVAANRFLPIEIRQRLFSVESYTGTGTGRTIIWRHVIKDVLPNMGLFGLGAGCAPIRLSNFYGFYKGVHNTYLNMIAEFGILGIPCFLVMLASFFNRSRKSGFVIGTAMLAGICIIVFFLDSYSDKYFWSVILTLIIYDRITEKSNDWSGLKDGLEEAV